MKSRVPPLVVLALVLGCVAMPDTPEFRQAQSQCRGIVASRCLGLPGQLAPDCVQHSERACMAELGFGWERGHGWVRRAGTDRDVRLELEGELRKLERRSEAPAPR